MKSLGERRSNLRDFFELYANRSVMKNNALLLLLFTLPFFSFAPAAELPIGADMPKADLKVKDISGKEVSLKEAVKKNGVLVMFSCNTCPFVERYQQRTKEIAAYALKNDVGVILLNSNAGQRDSDDSFEAMKDYAKEQGYNWYYAVDEKNVLADAFGATRTPESFLFNKDSKLVYHGAIDDNADASDVKRLHLQLAIDEMVSGKDVSVKTTRFVGCGIKRI